MRGACSGSDRFRGISSAMPRRTSIAAFLTNVVLWDLVAAVAHAQRTPSVAIGVAWGHQSDGYYSSRSWTGIQGELMIPVYPLSPSGAIVVEVTRDEYWNGSGDDCVVRPPASGCVPEPPSITAATVGWRLGAEHSRSVLYLGAGRMSGRYGATGGAIARLAVTLGSGHIAPRAFGQAMLMPSYRQARLGTFLAGISLLVR